jgi:hypothetical protein
MAKSRSINSAIRMSQSFAKLTHRQRDLWHGIIVTADDQGRMPGLSAAVRSMVWPLDDISVEEVESDLVALEANGMIERYHFDGKSYLQIINWWKYQKMQWAGESSYPPPEGWLDRCRYHGPGREIMYKNWKTPGGYCIVVNDDDKVNVNDDVNVKPLTQTTTTNLCDKGSQTTPYSRLSTFFVNLSSIPELTGGAQKWNETINKWVDVGLTEDDLRSAYKILRSKGYSLTGPWSLTNTAIGEMSKRKSPSVIDETLSKIHQDLYGPK